MLTGKLCCNNGYEPMGVKYSLTASHEAYLGTATLLNKIDPISPTTNKTDKQTSANKTINC